MITTTDRNTKQYFVEVKKEVLLEIGSMMQVLQDLMASYFVFNISYQKPLKSLLFYNTMFLV